jgi:secreted trypsin-like serine protease
LDNGSGKSAGSCTGSLLKGGLYILTAAHCITDENGRVKNITTQVDFPWLDNTYISRLAKDYFVLPGWLGANINGFLTGNDLAILKLDSPAPTELQQYDIYRSTDEVNQVFTILGYGLAGTGDRGVTKADNQPGEVKKRLGQNRFDRIEGTITGNQLGFDFDNGKPENDAYGLHFGLNDTGLGINEADFAPGDSGGPSFLGNLIAGVTSWEISDAVLLEDGTVKSRYPDGKIADIDPAFNPLQPTNSNSTFGEFGFVTRVSNYSSYVDDVLAGKVAPSRIPEPSSVLGIIAFGLSGFFIRRQRKNKRQATHSGN